MLLDEGRCRRAIGEAFPSIDIGSVRYFAAGWDYELWEVNDDLLFRFPQRAECGPPLRIEARLLAALADRLSVPVPTPEYVTDGCESFPLPFFAYRKLPGVPLAEAGPGPEAMRSIGEQAGRFLAELHSFPVDRAAELGVRVRAGERWRQRYVRLRERVRADVYPLLEDDETKRIEAFWEDFLGREEYVRFRPALIHSDLDDAHVLVDAERGGITGVIDFGDALVGDPALDFAGFEGSFRDAILQSYELPLDETFGERPDLYRRISPFHAVLFGLDIAGDEGLVRRGIDAIRARITNEDRQVAT